MRAQRRRQMRARRESQHPHLLWIDAPLRRMLPHHPHCPLRILECRRRLRIRSRPRHAILQQHAVHANPIQPVANLRPLQIHRQNRITAARKHHHRRTRILPFRRLVQSDRRLRHISQPHHPAPRDQRHLRCRRVVFRTGRRRGHRARPLRPRLIFRIRRALRPQLHLRMARRRWPAITRRLRSRHSTHTKAPHDRPKHTKPHDPKSLPRHLSAHSTRTNQSRLCALCVLCGERFRLPSSLLRTLRRRCLALRLTAVRLRTVLLTAVWLTAVLLTAFLLPAVGLPAVWLSAARLPAARRLLR